MTLSPQITWMVFERRGIPRTRLKTLWDSFVQSLEEAGGEGNLVVIVKKCAMDVLLHSHSGARPKPPQPVLSDGGTLLHPVRFSLVLQGNPHASPNAAPQSLRRHALGPMTAPNDQKPTNAPPTPVLSSSKAKAASAHAASCSICWTQLWGKCLPPPPNDPQPPPPPLGNGL